MAEQIVSDLLMKFVDLSGDAIDGDAMTSLPDKKGPMLNGFEKTRMFEVQSFNFKTGLGGQDLDKKDEQQKKENEKTTGTLNEHASMLNDLAEAINNMVGMHNTLATVLNSLGETVKSVNSSLKSVNPSTKGGASGVKTVDPNAKGVDGSAKSVKSASSQGFLKFRNNTMTKDTRYPVDMKPMEFERTIDRTSLLLMNHCIKRIPFKSATLIKRKAAGGPASGEVFLRFDFNTVLIKSVEWDDGTPVKEKVEFICRAVTIHYKPQLPNGTLGAPIQAFWKASDTSTIVAENLR